MAFASLGELAAITPLGEKFSLRAMFSVKLEDCWNEPIQDLWKSAYCLLRSVVDVKVRGNKLVLGYNCISSPEEKHECEGVALLTACKDVCCFSQRLRNPSFLSCTREPNGGLPSTPTCIGQHKRRMY